MCFQISVHSIFDWDTSLRATPVLTWCRSSAGNAGFVALILAIGYVSYNLFNYAGKILAMTCCIPAHL